MIETWTLEEIEKILIQLDQKKLPFAGYQLEQTEQGLHLLGKGGFSLVFEAKGRKKSKNRYAIKVIGFQNHHVVKSDSFQESVQIQQELDSLDRGAVSVKNATELYVWIGDDNQILQVKKECEDSFLQDKNILQLQFLVMEKLEPVLKRDKNNKPYLYPEKLAEFDENEIMKLLCDIGNILKKAHDKKILHRDIKLENIFYDSKHKKYKLGDFGISKVTEDGIAGTVAFTQGYGAPEIVGKSQELYDCTADIYSFGMMAYVLFNRLKFPGSNNYHVNLSTQYKEEYTIPAPELGNADLHKVIKKMCQFHPTDRYQSMDEILLDFLELQYSSDMRYKTKHNKSTGVMALMFCIASIAFGIPSWSHDWVRVFEFSNVFLLLLILGIGAYLCKLLEKKASFFDTGFCLVGIYWVFSNGFQWKKVLVLLMICIAKEVISIILFLCFIINKMMLMGVIDITKIQEFRWISITLLIFTVMLFNQYNSMNQEEFVLEFSKKYMFRKRRYWMLMGTLFALSGLTNILLKIMETYGILENHIFYGTKILEFFCREDMKKIGVLGFSLCLIWLIREIILDKIEKKRIT